MADQANFEKWLHSDDGCTAVGWLVLDDKHRALRLAYAAGVRDEKQRNQKMWDEAAEEGGKLSSEEWTGAQLTTLKAQGHMTEEEYKTEMAELDKGREDDNAD